MLKTKYVVTSALMATFAAIFQCLPVVFSEAVVILTILSALPIYIAGRLNPLTGTLSYFVATFLILFVSVHEGLFFLCSNGIVGLSLGVCRYYKRKKLISVLISSLLLSLFLVFMNYVIGIPVFGTAIPGVPILVISILLLFSMTYNFLYLSLADFLFQRLKTTKII